MNCHSVQHRLSAYRDGSLSRLDKGSVLSHLEECDECAVRYEKLAHTRRAMRSLRVLTPPARLTSALRIMASRERLRRLGGVGLGADLSRWVSLRKLRLGNWMRPVALPFAGGLVSAVVLFSMLAPSFTLRVNPSIEDVPLSFFTEAAVKTMAPFGFSDNDFVVEVHIDERGRLVDYSIPVGQALPTDPGLLRRLENNLLFTQFTPATSFGRPTSSRIFVVFSRSQINVQS